MKEQLIKAMQRNQLVNLMYASKTGEITKRRVKIIKVVNNWFQAFCFTKQSKRTFIIDNVLAVAPLIQKERGVV
ncbi:transcriptional regulator [Viridibacillus sp. NPDC093762]|uniref:transcriptional regulator n=1 Tax=Viridibacillus sp. NPDC093762 TaxID=3390720 RepID=UPI003CFE7A18